MERPDIVPYRPRLAKGFAALRADVTARHGAPCLWDVGERWLWNDTQCALEGRRLIAAAQVRPIVIAAEGEEPHRLYVSLNALASREGDEALYAALYERIEQRARAIAALLPGSLPTLLCASLLGGEAAARAFFEAKGFAPALHILAMAAPTLGGETAPGVEAVADPKAFGETFEEQAAEDSPLLDELGLPEPPGVPVQTTLGIRADGRLCGRLVLYEQGGVASIEDVFVLRDFRGRGLARALVRHALTLLAGRGYTTANLQVLGTNAAALSLYRDLGFTPAGEETRLQRPLLLP